jgi:hypothetical protein
MRSLILERDPENKLNTMFMPCGLSTREKKNERD